MMKKILVSLLAFSMIVTMAACGSGGGGGSDSGSGDKTTSGAATDFGKQFKGDGVIDVCFASEPQSLDPALSSTVDGGILAGHLFEGLIRYVDDGKGNAVLGPGTAEKWETSEDGLTWTFHLRDNAVWSDGKPVTAKDFVYSWNRLVDPNTAADYAYILGMVATKPDGTLKIDAPDDHTFVVTLAAPTPFFDEICAFPACSPVREDIIKAKGDQWTFDPKTYISNGQYTLKEWKHNSYILMAKSDTYYNKDAVKADTIKFHLMDDANAIYAAYNSGELDYAQTIPPEEVPGLLKSGELKTLPQLGTYYVAFNNQKAPFDNPKVREAFSLAIDRNYIVQKVTRRGETPASGFVPLGINDNDTTKPDFRTEGGDWYSTKPDDYEKNCEKAKELMKEAGYPDGKGFPVVEYSYNTDANHKAIAESLQNMWQTQLGVTVTLQNQDWNTFIAKREAGDFQMARDGWIGDYNDPMTFLDLFLSKSGNNDPKFKNPDYDKLIADTKATGDQSVRLSNMHKAEDMLKDGAVLAPIYYYTNPYLMNPNLKGWYYTPMGFFFFGQTTGQ